LNFVNYITKVTIKPIVFLGC